ncbi:MAG TPA: nodulation protein NfeD [Gammaproteobacteria bacterium]
MFFPASKCNFPVRGRLLRIGLCWAMLMAGSWSAVHGDNPAGQSPVYQVNIDSTINPGALGLLEHAIRTAEANQAAALIVRIDTPGGLLSTTRDMVSAISQSRVPVIGYVGPSGANAGSAGAFILLATHVAVMNTGTNLGASSPVTGDGGEIEGTMGKKVMNDSKAFMRSIAAWHGRNAEVAEGFVSEAHSLTAQEAKEQNVIDLVIEDTDQLLAAVNGREINFHGERVTLDIQENQTRLVKPRLVDRLLLHIAHPQIAHMLISLGMLGIYVEILSPGLAFPGIFGAIAVILGLVAVQTLPVNLGFLLLLFLGIALIVAEYFVAGFGVLGIGGAIAFILGSFNLFDTSMSTGDHRGAILSISIAISVVMVLTTFLITRSIISDPRGRQKQLRGKTGEAMVSFDSQGYVLVGEQRWPAETLEPLRHGDRIVVIKTDETGRLTVRKAES